MKTVMNQLKEKNKLEKVKQILLPAVSCEVEVEVDDKCSSLMLSISDFMMLLSEKWIINV